MAGLCCRADARRRHSCAKGTGVLTGRALQGPTAVLWGRLGPPVEQRRGDVMVFPAGVVASSSRLVFGSLGSTFGEGGVGGGSSGSLEGCAVVLLTVGGDVDWLGVLTALSCSGLLACNMQAAQGICVIKGQRMEVGGTRAVPTDGCVGKPPTSRHLQDSPTAADRRRVMLPLAAANRACVGPPLASLKGCVAGDAGASCRAHALPCVGAWPGGVLLLTCCWGCAHVDFASVQSWVGGAAARGGQ